MLYKEKADYNKLSLAEDWKVKTGDSVTVQLLPNPKGIEIEFYFNHEKVGTWVCDSTENDHIEPYCEVTGNLNFFFNLSMVPLKVRLY